MLVKQLNNIAQEVGEKKCKNALIQMFSIKTAFVKKLFSSGLTRKSNLKI